MGDAQQCTGGKINIHTAHVYTWQWRVFKSVVFPRVNSRSEKKTKVFLLLFRHRLPLRRRIIPSPAVCIKELHRTGRRFAREAAASIYHDGYCSPLENTECQYTFYCVYTPSPLSLPKFVPEPLTLSK